MLVTMSDKELNRINVIQSVVEKRMRRRDAAHQLALTERQTQRLMNRFRESGAAGLANLRRVPMMRAIDKGLANSRIGLVLVTPVLLSRLPKEGVADKELSALLAGNQLVPIVHNTTYEALRNVSPLLASRSGLDTGEDTLAVVATKIAELITV